MLTLTLLLLFAAGVVAILSALGKAQLWIAVLLLTIAVLVATYPARLI